MEEGFANFLSKSNSAHQQTLLPTLPDGSAQPAETADKPNNPMQHTLQHGKHHTAEQLKVQNDAAGCTGQHKIAVLSIATAD